MENKVNHLLFRFGNRIFKSYVLVILLLAIVQVVFAGSEKKPIYKNAEAPIEKRIDDLLKRMTIEEKVFQLNQIVLGENDNINNVDADGKIIDPKIGSLLYVGTDPVLRNAMQRKAVEETRLGIPILFGYDVIHGFNTIYPISLAQACSWNPDLVQQACSVAAKEARSSGVDWTFSPMVDVARDGRWGRVSEGYGEDTYTNSVFAVASVKGYQGDDLSNQNNIASCLKHYVGYSASEGGKDYVSTDISRQSLWDTYLPPFEAGINAGAVTVMSAFNTLNGIPASCNQYTLTDILIDKWKFDGFVVSDWNAVVQLIAQGVAADEKEATRMAFQAGVDLDMADELYQKYLPELIESGVVSEKQIDKSVRRILRVKFKLGLFDNPYVSEKNGEGRIVLPEVTSVIEKLTEESMVLLKNENHILPLKEPSTIALIGPMAKDDVNMMGSWAAHGNGNDVVNIYEGLTKEFSDSRILYAKGCNFDRNNTSKYAAAIETAKQADIVVLCLGEKWRWSGENGSRSTLSLPEIQENLLAEIKKVGKPIVLLLSNGRPLDLSRMESECDAIVEMWQPGILGGRAVAGILSGRVNPSGKLAITFPYSTGQIPIYYNKRPSSRPNQGKYQDIQDAPLYEFGYGLSYTTFEYGTLKTSNSKVKKGEEIIIEVPVTNTGNRESAETVHWFISDPVCSIARPQKELKYFEKQIIKAGETKVFRFKVDLEKDFGFVDAEGNKFLESGEYYVMVNSQRVKIEVLD